jgi:uncharacterized protein DUF2789
MYMNIHTLQALFEQLGLPSQDAAIETFLAQHRLLESEPRLVQADFWTASQRAFLQESLMEDSDWAEVVDQLDALLRD